MHRLPIRTFAHSYIRLFSEESRARVAPQQNENGVQQSLLCRLFCLSKPRVARLFLGGFDRLCGAATGVGKPTRMKTSASSRLKFRTGIRMRYLPIRNSQFAICNSQFAIRNLQFAHSPIRLFSRERDKRWQPDFHPHPPPTATPSARGRVGEGVYFQGRGMITASSARRRPPESKAGRRWPVWGSYSPTAKWSTWLKSAPGRGWMS